MNLQDSLAMYNMHAPSCFSLSILISIHCRHACMATLMPPEQVFTNEGGVEDFTKMRSFENRVSYVAEAYVERQRA